MSKIPGDLSRLWNNDENGCLLVRPDGYIAWSSNHIDDAMAELYSVMMHILQR